MSLILRALAHQARHSETPVTTLPETMPAPSQDKNSRPGFRQGPKGYIPVSTTLAGGVAIGVLVLSESEAGRHAYGSL